MIKADFHMHTSFSSDSETMPEKMVEEAIRMGLKTICFTDHQDFDFREKKLSSYLILLPIFGK